MSFQKCIPIILKEEGGNVDDPHDPGGRTSRGVTQRVYTAYRSVRGQLALDVFKMSNDECIDIYRQQYWKAINGDNLNEGLDLAIFDYAVNSGPVTAIKALQRALRIPADGHFGIVTERALSVAQVKGVRIQLVVSVCEQRLSLLEALRTWRFYGKGWKARVANIRSAAIGMI